MKEEFFKYSEIPFCLFDSKLNYVDLNLAYENVFKLKRETVIGRNLADVSATAIDSGRYQRYEEVLATGKPANIDLELDFPDRGIMSARLFAFKTGEGLGISITPITDLMETITDLDTFLYKAVHDMRSPLASVIGLLNIAENEEDVVMLRQYLQLMRQQTEKMDNLLKAFSGTFRNEPLSFNILLSELMISLTFLEGFKEVEIQTKVNLNRAYIGNKALVTSVLQNLVENAIKYRNRAAGKSYVNIDISEENEKVHIAIGDNGIGIDEQDQKNIFKLFFRASSDRKGHGVGLYAVMSSVKKLGGEMSFKSEPGTGTTFHIYLPFKTR